VAGTVANPIGITNPPIDELLAATDSKYSLVIYAAKRARQINAYYSQLGEGLLEYVGPLVETGVQEKPLSIALREINGGPALARAGRRPRRSRDAWAPMSRVVLGVAGGIAAYKAVELLRALTESGHDVTVVPHRAALQFVGRPTWVGAVRQARCARRLADVARGARTSGSARRPTSSSWRPATADLLARAAHGLADDLLTNVLLTARCPVLLAPAMHTEMWEHAATQANVATLRAAACRSSSPPSAG
jgi:DNA-directed RNA polymerase omega subunit